MHCPFNPFINEVHNDIYLNDEKQLMNKIFSDLVKVTDGELHGQIMDVLKIFKYMQLPVHDAFQTYFYKW